MQARHQVCLCRLLANVSSTVFTTNYSLLLAIFFPLHERIKRIPDARSGKLIVSSTRIMLICGQWPKTKEYAINTNNPSAINNTPPAGSHLRVKAAEDAIAGRTIDEASAEDAGEAAVSGASALTMNKYKIHIARTMVKRAILACK